MLYGYVILFYFDLDMKPGLRTSDNYYDQQNYHEEMDFSQEVDDWAQFLGSIGGGGTASKPFSELL